MNQRNQRLTGRTALRRGKRPTRGAIGYMNTGEITSATPTAHNPSPTLNAQNITDMSSPVFGVHAGAVRGRARNRRRSGRTRTEALLVRFHPAIRHESCDRCHLSCVLRSHRIRHVVHIEPVGQRRYECNQPRRVCRNWHYRRDWHCVRAAAGIAQLAVGQPAIEVFGGLGCSAPLPALIIVALMAIPVAVAVWAPGGLFFVGFFWGLLFAGCSVWLDVVAMRRQRVFDDPLVTADEARNSRSTPSPTSRPFTN